MRTGHPIRIFLRQIRLGARYPMIQASVFFRTHRIHKQRLINVAELDFIKRPRHLDAGADLIRLHERGRVDIAERLVVAVDPDRGIRTGDARQPAV